MKWCMLVLMGLVALIGVGNAQGAITTYFGEDLGLGEGTPLLSWPTAAAAQASFLANLTGVGVENLESFANGTGAPLAISFGAAGTATLNGGGNVAFVTPGTTNGVGRYAISGSQYWESTQSFWIDFSTPQAAFGFYGVDIGDFNGQVTLTMVSGANTVLNVGNSTNIAGGSVLYYGFIATGASEQFTRVTFGNTASGTDYFGFDDFTIGTLEQVHIVPEPVSVIVWSLLSTLGLTFGWWDRRNG